jgi:hypothetical protein
MITLLLFIYAFTVQQIYGMEGNVGFSTTKAILHFSENHPQPIVCLTGDYKKAIPLEEFFQKLRRQFNEQMFFTHTVKSENSTAQLIIYYQGKALTTCTLQEYMQWCNNPETLKDNLRNFLSPVMRQSQFNISEQRTSFISVPVKENPLMLSAINYDFKPASTDYNIKQDKVEEELDDNGQFATPPSPEYTITSDQFNFGDAAESFDENSFTSID